MIPLILSYCIIIYFFLYGFLLKIFSSYIGNFVLWRFFLEKSFQTTCHGIYNCFHFPALEIHLLRILDNECIPHDIFCRWVLWQLHEQDLYHHWFCLSKDFPLWNSIEWELLGKSNFSRVLHAQTSRQLPLSWATVSKEQSHINMPLQLFFHDYSEGGKWNHK